MSTSVVVVSHRPGNWLATCLESVQDQADEVIVVDNASEDASASAAARAAGAYSLRSPVNLGFAGGVNLGVSKARGRFVALLNDDAVACPHWIDSATQILADPSVAAIGPKVLLAGLFAEICLDGETWFSATDHRPLGRRISSVTSSGREVLEELAGDGVHRIEREGTDCWRWTTGGGRPFYVPVPGSAGDVPERTADMPAILVDGEQVSPRRICRLVNSAGCYLRGDGYAGDVGLETPDDGDYDEPAERFALSGVALVTHAANLEGSNAFASRFFAYYEDVDWCWRMRINGLRLLYDPTATVLHHRSATSGGIEDPRVRFLGERNRMICIARNAPLRTASSLVWQWIGEAPGDGARRAMLGMLPWALATRSLGRPRGDLRAARLQVWGRWAGKDVTPDARERAVA